MDGKSSPGLAKRMREFFERNPDEWLTKADMVAKFSCSPRTLENVVRRLGHHGIELEAVTVWRRKAESSDLPKP